MPRDELQHVIEKPDAGAHARSGRGRRAPIRSAICVSVVRRSITARRTAPLPSPRSRASCARRCRRRCGCSRRSRARSSDRGGRRRARARLAPARRVRSPAQTSTKFDAALPVRQAEPIARGVEQRLRFGDLPQIAVQVIEIAERGLNAADRGDVHAVDRDRLPDRVHRLRRADEAADAQAGQAERLRERAADDHVRKARRARE